MMEMKITVEAPDLAASILKLAEAIASGPDPALLIPDEPLPVSAYPATPAPPRDLRPLWRPLWWPPAPLPRLRPMRRLLARHLPPLVTPPPLLCLLREPPPIPWTKSPGPVPPWLTPGRCSSFWSS